MMGTILVAGFAGLAGPVFLKYGGVNMRRKFLVTLIGAAFLALTITGLATAGHPPVDNHPPQVEILPPTVSIQCYDIGLSAMIQDENPLELLTITWVTFEQPEFANVYVTDWDKQFAIACVNEPGKYLFGLYVMDTQGLQTIKRVDVVVPSR